MCADDSFVSPIWLFLKVFMDVEYGLRDFLLLIVVKTRTVLFFSALQSSGPELLYSWGWYIGMGFRPFLPDNLSNLSINI